MKTQIERYQRPSSLAEALAAKQADPGAAWLAGGTFLLAGDFRDKPASVLDIGRILPRAVTLAGGTLTLGTGATFQDIADSPVVPQAFKAAVLGMNNRNVRNRATLGGNLGANKSCGSLLPLLLVLEAELETSGGRRAVADWLAKPEGLVLNASVKLDPARGTAYGRWARTSCDLAVLNVAVSLTLSGGRIAGLRIALGGLAPHARRFPELEKLFEGQELPAKEAIEAAVAPLLTPIDDHRASAAFKRFRAAALVADALHDACQGATQEASK